MKDCLLMVFANKQDLPGGEWNRPASRSPMRCLFHDRRDQEESWTPFIDRGSSNDGSAPGGRCLISRPRVVGLHLGTDGRENPDHRPRADVSIRGLFADSLTAMSPAEVTEKLGLHKMRERTWYVHPR